MGRIERLWLAHENISDLARDICRWIDRWLDLFPRVKEIVVEVRNLKFCGGWLWRRSVSDGCGGFAECAVQGRKHWNESRRRRRGIVYHGDTGLRSGRRGETAGQGFK